MNIYLLRDYIGLYAPIILFSLSLFLLRNYQNYLQLFVIGFVFNNILNIFLKLAIKEPRPSKDEKAIEIGVTNGARIGFDKFGMPSGHAQNCGFCLTFITLVLNDPLITAIYSVVTLISLFQRYLYNNHTILQLLVGLFVGSSIAYITYLKCRKMLTGNIKMRPDDGAPK